MSPLTPSQKKYAGAAAVVLAIAVAVALVVTVVWKPWADDIPKGTAFKIGDDAVSVSDLNSRNDSLRALYGIEAPLEEEALDKFRRRAAKSMAISLVLDRAVKDEKITVAKADLDQAMDVFVTQNFGGDHNAFVDALGNVNTSEKEVRREVERQIALRLLLKEIAKDVAVTDEELAAAFTERKASLDLPQRREVSNIVVATKQEAQKIRNQLDKGGDVATLAQTNSLDQATRDKGGALGAVSLAEFEPAVGPVVFKTRAGSAYGPVQGSFGWNVGVVTKVLPPQPATLAKDGPRLREVLIAEQSQALWSTWLEKKMRAADIRYAEPYRPEDPYDTNAWVSDQTGGTTGQDQQ